VGILAISALLRAAPVLTEEALATPAVAPVVALAGGRLLARAGGR
jgi:hypothetical protein